MINAVLLEELFSQHALKGGKEHKVALINQDGRVIKDLDTQAIATESLFDYLTDHALSNYFFGDDIRLEGFYLKADRLHLVLSQPYVSGRHPDWDTLKSGLEGQGLSHSYPLSRIPAFSMDGGAAGLIEVIDLHENNVILGSQSGWLHPIDAHFYFADRDARQAALRALGLDD